MLENRATENGGGIYSQTNSQILFGSNSSITLGNNKATLGGAIYSDANSNVTFQSPVTITFTQNEASRYGGSLHLQGNSIVKFEGDSTVTYCKNRASKINGNGGAIYCDNSVVLIQEKSNVTFNENTAIDGGALYLQFESNIVFYNNSLATFSNNTATTSGGAISFETNSRGVFGGTTRLSFSSNSATKSGGAMYLGNNVSLSFEKFFDNANPTKMFSQNSVETGGAIFMMISEIQIDNNSVIFDNNTTRQDGGAIYSDQSNLSFINDCNIIFSNNTAHDYGGAIYGIFAIEMNDSALNINSTNVEFDKNDARIAGDSIYINLPQGCEQGCLSSRILVNVNDSIEHITTSSNELKLYATTRCINITDNKECKVYYIDNIMLGQEILLDACMYDYYNKESDAAQFLVSACSTGNDNVGDDNTNFTLGLNTTTISCNHTIPDIRINAKKISLNYHITTH